ncbi:peptide chain release factor 1 [Candidatus Woesearchaeota archaeon]|nr:peptide chain release factor 1 [Candidatus Woesearchaeota archaeon]
MSLTALERFELKKLIKELKPCRGRHTELVTVYVPAGYDLNKVISHLAQEQGTAENIKSTSTRKNVIDALERMIQHLRLFKRTPENGLAVFSGNIAEREGQSDVRVWSIEPAVPLKIRMYRCDKDFKLEPLEELLETKEVYGMVVIDRRDAMLAFLKGKTIIPLVKTHSEVPGKTKAGGQSAHRFAQIREGAKVEHFKKIAEYMKEEFLNKEGLKGIIVGGPNITVNDFLGRDYVTGDVKKKIIAVKDLSYTGEFGLQELLDKSQDVLAQEEIAEEKKIMGRFFELLATKPKLVAYGDAEVRSFLEMGVVDTLILSENLSDEKIEEFEHLAQRTNVTVRLISTETREGVQLRDIGMIAAILRYELEH